VIAELHAGATFFMTGVIWHCQLVHYPLFPRARFDADYFSENVKRTARLVVPVMVVEAAAAAWLLLTFTAAAWLGAALLAGIWTSTLLKQWPQHRKLARGWSDETFAALMSGNRLRVLLWTLRALVAWRLLP
jgi:hypothetical protein